MDCGPTCLRMIAAYYGHHYALSYLREHSYIDREGVSLRGIVEAAEHIGMRTMAVKLSFEGYSEDEPGLRNAFFPCIVHWRQKHFVVVYKINNKYVWIADPAIGRRKLSHAAFKKDWISEADKGVALLLEPTPDFYQHENQQLKKTGFSFLFHYLLPYKSLGWQLALGIILGSFIQLLFPILTQNVVDIGIDNQDLNFVYLVLIGQLVLFLGQISVNVIQSWILLHIGNRVNISLISDFLIKLMRLPISFFDAKMTGDLLQRIGDHRRIELFLTSSTLSVVFSVFTFFIFSIILGIYNMTILGIFLLATALYLLWIRFWLRQRAEVDHLRFQEMAENQNALIELIQGMQEIKLQRSERKRRWQWMNIQARLYRVNIRSLRITQWQDTGASMVNQIKDIFITFFAARAVINGEMTLGMMLAVQYIVGQLNGPLQQFILFIRAAQDARISLERLGEIHEQENEEAPERQGLDLLPENADIHIEKLSFRYNQMSPYALENIDLTIPAGKVTAIVGTSGSGKTTLVKLLLGFYPPTEGQIKIGGLHLSHLSTSLWRAQCGAVMQEGFVFSDSIARNIAESEDIVDKAKLLQSVKMANIQEFIESLPLGYNTKVGAKGNGLSQGQKQRLLIARAVYKNPSFLFFDEATNALDAQNEKIILENMEAFFENRTVVVVAHRLSTVKNADQIIVLEKGKLIEKGKHTDLVKAKGAYYRLVKNQLELGT